MTELELLELLHLLARANALDIPQHKYLAAHRTQALGRSLLEPLDDAMEVEVVQTRAAENNGTRVARIPSAGAVIVEGNSADSTELVDVSQPVPCGHSTPVLDVYLHGLLR